MITLELGKLNISLDGQFGSTGKGLLNAFIASDNHIDIAITNNGPNSGHTFYWHGQKYVLKQLPVSGIISKRSTIYLCAGAIINIKLLFEEMDKYYVNYDRLFIHPRAAIIDEEDILNEQTGKMVKISSTQNGVGESLARKVLRKAKLAEDYGVLRPYICDVDLEYLLKNGCTAFFEVPQGIDLGLNSGFAYPYCTSREISVMSALSDIQIHPHYLGKVAVCLRTNPIRVGNLQDEDGNEIGYSGPFYSDSVETTWEDMDLPNEMTTRTNRVRRVASFSMIQYEKMLRLCRPDYILLNFMNHLNSGDGNMLLNKLPEVTHLGYGPHIKDVKNRGALELL